MRDTLTPGTAPRGWRALLLAIVAAALVGTNVVGLLHAIAHAGEPRVVASQEAHRHDAHGHDAHGHDAHVADAPSSSSAGHSCAALDALSLGVGPPADTAPSLLPPPRLAVEVGRDLRHAVVAPHRRYLARAPPAIS